MIKRSRAKTAVFAGFRQRSDSPREIGTLEELCIQKLLDNASKIECVGDVPYQVLGPLMMQLPSLDLLRRIEFYNPHLAEDDKSHLPWERFCKQYFERKLRRDKEPWEDFRQRYFKNPICLKEIPKERHEEYRNEQWRLFWNNVFPRRREQRRDELWKEFCKRKHTDETWDQFYERRNDVKDWREIFHSLERERDHKIDKTAKRIKRHEEKATQQRQVRVVENQLSNGKKAIQTVIRKTIRNHVPVRGGHSSNGSSTPSSSSASSRPGTVMKTTTVVIRREAGNGSGSKLLKPKTAPLMQKSLQLFKSRFRR